jgi:DNA polymerase III epsilon subunit-like protein
MDSSSWFRDWAEQYDGFPDNYLVFDTEASGSAVERDLILQIGWCKVIDRKVVDNNGLTLNWLHGSLIDPNWLKGRMEETNRHLLSRKDEIFPWTSAELEKGHEPINVLCYFWNMIREANEDGLTFVAHNGIGFDIPILTAHFQRYLKVNLDINTSEVWDTGALEKASQLDEYCYNELPGDFAYRILLREDRGIKWGLHSHALPKYNLIEKYSLDMQQSHTAPFDAYVTHLLLEEFRSLAGQTELETDRVGKQSS